MTFPKYLKFFAIPFCLPGIFITDEMLPIIFTNFVEFPLPSLTTRADGQSFRESLLNGELGDFFNKSVDGRTVYIDPN